MKQFIITDVNAPLVMPSPKPALVKPEAFNDAIKLVCELRK